MSKSVQSNSAVLVHFTLKLDDGSTAESPAATANRRCFASATPLCLKGWSNSFSV